MHLVFLFAPSALEMFVSTVRTRVRRYNVFQSFILPSGHCLSTHCPLSINTCFMWRDISLLSEGISTKLAQLFTFNWHCWQGLQGQSSKVKVTLRANALVRQTHTFWRCGVEAHMYCIVLYWPSTTC